MEPAPNVLQFENRTCTVAVIRTPCRTSTAVCCIQAAIPASCPRPASAACPLVPSDSHANASSTSSLLSHTSRTATSDCRFGHSACTPWSWAACSLTGWLPAGMAAGRLPGRLVHQQGPVCQGHALRQGRYQVRPSGPAWCCQCLADVEQLATSTRQAIRAHPACGRAQCLIQRHGQPRGAGTCLCAAA